MDNNWINLGLVYIGAYLKAHSYKVDLIDIRGMSNWAEFEDEIKKRDSDIVGIHFNTPNYNHALKCARIAKGLGRVVVAGGPHTVVDAESLIASGFIDYVIAGEGEKSFLELLEAGGSREVIIKGEMIEDLDEIPFPDRDLYNMERLIHPVGNFPYLDNGVILMASRGCPFNCAFCQPLVKKMFGKKIRYRSVGNIIEEIRFIIEKYRVKYISFQDDNLTTNKEWLLDLCEKMRKEGLDIQWSAQSRVDTFDEEIAKGMAQAGCVCVFFGFESGSQRILNLLRKKITPEESIRAAQLCRKYGLLIFADYMLGIPTETEEDLRMTLDLIKKIRPEVHSPTYFTPVPGCDLFEYCRNKGLINITTYEDYTRNPQGEKIKGIDYRLVRRYKNNMIRYTPYWYQERHFAKMAIERWKHLIRKNYTFHVLYEFFLYSFNIINLIRRTLGEGKAYEFFRWLYYKMSSIRK